MALAPGTRLGPYEILPLLGVGGMGEVYRARDTKLGRDVAIKILSLVSMSNPGLLARFQHEARVLATLNHPHIGAIYGFEAADGVSALVLELVAGDTLSDRVRRGPLPLKEALLFARQIAEALDAAHSKGIIHRDLKPANIKITPESGVKVLDFGIAKVISEGTDIDEKSPTAQAQTAGATEAGMILGTPAYMSPEQACGEPVDKRTDVWAFGCVFYEMLTGRSAFGRDRMIETLAAIVEGEPDLSALPPNTPPGARRLLLLCLEKDPKQRLRDIGDGLALLDERDVPPQVLPPLAKPRRQSLTWAALALLFAAIGALVISFVAGWRLHHPPPTPLPWQLTRLTADAGVSNASAISPDGKLVAYASDRSHEGQFELYVKQTAGGDPIRLTFDGANNTAPDFSPDGSKLVFQSNRDGGGIYEIPAFGGEARRLARDGNNPRFSPDGSQVAYWVGDHNVAAAVPGSGTVWVVSGGGGQPQQLGTNFTAARYPIWAPDSRHLLIVGYTSKKTAYEGSSIDWWILPINGDPPLKTGMYDALARARHLGTGPVGQWLTLGNLYFYPDVPRPSCWLSTTNNIVFAAPSGDTSDLWETGISPKNGKVSGEFKRLTTGVGNETEASCALGDALTFTNSEVRTDIWSLPFDLNGGRQRGTIQRVTQGIASLEYVSLSSNGATAAFDSNQSGPLNIWLMQLNSGQESHLASSSFVQRFPCINPSGSKIAYSSYEHDKRFLYVSTPGASPEQLCDNCLRATDWSQDETKLLVFGSVPYQINLLDIASHQQTPVLKHPTYSLLYGRFSPDHRLVSFNVRIQPNRSWIAIAPIDGPLPVPENSWIKIAEGGAEDWANWSPDGKTLYFTSPKDGHTCLWGQRIDPDSHHPVGTAFAVQHLHGRASYRQGGWSAAGGRIAILLRDSTENIWMMSRSPSR